MRASPLTIVTQVLVIMAALTIMSRAAIDLLRPPPPPPPVQVGGMAFTAFATNNAASFAFTNITSDIRVACVKGVVKSIATGIRLESLPVCSGEMKPNTSVRFDASWPKGNPEDICYKDTQYGKHLDWSKCTFDAEELPPALAPVTPIASR